MLTKEQLDDLRWRMQGSPDHESDWRIVEDALRMQREAIAALARLEASRHVAISWNAELALRNFANLIEGKAPDASPPINRWAALTRLVEMDPPVEFLYPLRSGGRVWEIWCRARMLGTGPTLDAALDDAVAREREGA